VLESLAVGRFIFTVAVGVWLGTLVSFSYIVLPSIHAVLSGNQSRELLRRLFPHYYLSGVVCGLLALAAVSLTPASPSLPIGERLRLALPVALAVVCFLVARQVLLPRLHGLGADKEPARYQRLHQFAAMLNSTALAMLVLVLAAVSTR
jgi:hypothetical protein